MKVKRKGYRILHAEFKKPAVVIGTLSSKLSEQTIKEFCADHNFGVTVTEILYGWLDAYDKKYYKYSTINSIYVITEVMEQLKRAYIEYKEEKRCATECNKQTE